MNMTREVLRLEKAARGTVRDVVFDFLREQGVDRVFGNPGSTELPLYANLPEGIGYVLGLQESVVVAMADGYAQATRKPAFVNLHSAAGLGHAMGSVYTAFRNRAPLVITTGQQSRSLLPHDPFLFAESPEELAKPYVKWAIQPARAADVPAAIARALFTAMQPPMGPVLVSVPLDDWDVPAERLPRREIRSLQGCDPAALDRLAERLDRSTAPALVVGPGLDIDGDWEPVVRLAENLEAEVWASPLSPRCSFPERHRLFAGFLPANQPALSDCLSRADTVLVLGAPVFTYHFPGPPEHLAEGTELWLVSDDPKQVAGAALGTGILGSPRAAAEGLVQRTRRKPGRFTQPLRSVKRVPEGPLTAELVYQTLTDLRSPDSIVVEEAPTARDALHDHFPIERSNGFFATASGGLGYGLPAAVGAALSRPDQPVIAVIGDGSSMYSIQALWSAVEHDVDLLVVVLNNAGYGALRQIAEKAQARRIDGTEIGHLDFVAIAEAQGCAAERVTVSGDLAGRLRDLLQRKGPRLLEVVLNEGGEQKMNVMHRHIAAPKAPEKFFIDGGWVEPLSDARLEVVSPVTEERILSYPEASAADMDRAVAAARRAFDTGPWPRLSAAERAKTLRRVAELLTARLDDIAEAWTLQVGAPISLTKKLVGQNPTLFNYYADMIDGGGYPLVDERKRDDGGRVRVVKEPVGVCAAVTPWNAPLVLLSYKVAAALAAGCTMVSKPSPETPLEAYILAECLEQAGVPKGVFNLVPAGRESGDYLVRHKDVDKVAFTGSTAAGKHIAGVCAERLARVSLELGGKSAAVLLDDADFSKAMMPLMIYSMPITGQVCFSLTRILVPESRKQEFTDMFVGAAKGIKVGDPFDPETQMGPLTMARQLERVQGYIAAGREQGAALLCGGGRPAAFDKGYFIEPTVFGDVTPDMKIAQEEIFGPVVSIIGYRDEEEAAQIANNSIYGLSGAVFTEDPERGYAMARRMRTGSVTINGMIVDPKHPFGGFKQSGMGREGGPEGLDNYVETKTIHYA